MTQKTAMQQMIEMIESVRRDEPPTALWNLKKYAQELLATEKEQHLNTYKSAVERYCRYDPERHGNEAPTGEQFYNAKYGQ